MRYIHVGVLLTLCLTVPVYGQGGKSAPEREDDKRTGTRATNPRDDVCSATKLIGLSEAQIIEVTKVVEGKAGFDSILDFICNIPNACLQKISMMTNGTLTAAQVTSAICRCATSSNIVDVILSTIKQVNKSAVCPNVIEALFTRINNPDCKINNNGIAALTRLSVPSETFMGCKNVSSAVKLLWPEDILKANIRNMTASEFQAFLAELAANVDRLKEAPCQVKLIGDFLTTNKLDFLKVALANPDFLKLMPFIPETICKSINYSMLLGIGLDTIKGLKWPCMGGFGEDDERKPLDGAHRSCSLSACGNAIAKAWLAGATIAIKDIKTTLGNLAQCVSFSDVVQKLKPGQCAGVPLARNPKDIYKAANSCKVNKDVQNLTSADIISMGCYAIKHNLERINATELCNVQVYEMVRGCLDDGDKKSMPDKTRTFTTLARKCIGDTITLSNVQILKEIIAYAPCSKLREMNGTIKTEFIKYFPEDIDETKLPCLPVTDLSVEVKMMKGAAKGTNSHDLLNEVRNNLQKVRDLDRMPELTTSQLDLILNEILDNKAISVLSDDEIRKVKGFITGLRSSEIDAVPLYKVQVIADVLCTNTNLNGRQTRAVFTLLMRLKSDSDPENPAGQLSPTDIENLGSTCVLETLRHVNNLTTESLKVACVKFGVSDRLYHITNRTIREYAADKCFDVLSGNVALLGNLFFDVSIEKIKSVDPVDLAANSSSLTRIHCASQEKLTAILDRIRMITVTAAVMTRIGDTPGLIAFMGSDSIADNAQYASRLAELLQDFEADETCNRTQTDAGREYISDIIARLLTKVAAVEGSTRRRRATAPITCTVLSSYSADQLENLKGEDISAINDFEVCIKSFGFVQNWDKEQLTALRNKFNTYLGSTNICDISSAQISQMGSIGYSLTPSEINCLKNLDLEAMIALGRVGGWTQAQAKALLDKYIEGKNWTPGSYNQLTPTDISTAAHLICGLSKEDAAKIVPGNFKPVIRQWSQTVLKCSVGTLEGLYTVVSHANAFGDIDEYDLNDMGIIAAGIPADKVSSWTSSHISSLSDTAIQHMTAERIKKLTISQLREFDYYQKLFLDMDSLTDDQKTGFTGDAAKSACSLIMVVMTIICCTLL